jgi:hypothetical protein
MTERNLKTKLLALEYVNRWNFHPHIHSQNVSAHSYNVTVITYFISEYFGIANEDKLLLLLQALFHDFSESVTGDIPTLVKRHLCNACKVKILDGQAITESINFYNNSDIGNLMKKELHPIVYLADFLDAFLYADYECNLGNKYFYEIRAELVGKIKQYVDIIAEKFHCSQYEVYEVLKNFVNCDFVSMNTKGLPEELSHI